MSLRVEKKGKKKRKRGEQDKERHTERIKEESWGEECKPEGSDETHGAGRDESVEKGDTRRIPEAGRQ